MILDVKSRRRNNIPPHPQMSDRRLEQSFWFESRPQQFTKAKEILFTKIEDAHHVIRT